MTNLLEYKTIKSSARIDFNFARICLCYCPHIRSSSFFSSKTRIKKDIEDISLPDKCCKNLSRTYRFFSTQKQIIKVPWRCLDVREKCSILFPSYSILFIPCNSHFVKRFWEIQNRHTEKRMLSGTHLSEYPFTQEQPEVRSVIKYEEYESVDTAFRKYARVN